MFSKTGRNCKGGKGENRKKRKGLFTSEGGFLEKGEFPSAWGKK